MLPRHKHCIPSRLSKSEIINPSEPNLSFSTAMSTIRPFKIDISDTAIELLHKKLDLTRLPGELEDAEWEFGAPL
jgi:hypothetical protein